MPGNSQLNGENQWQFLPAQGLVQRYAMGLYGVQLGNNTMADVLDEVKTIGGITKIDGLFNWYYTVSFGSKPVATVASDLATNLGIVAGQNGLSVGFVTFAKDYIAGVLNAAAPEARGAAVSQIIAAWENLAGSPEVGAAVSAWTANTANALAYASGAQNTADVAIGTAVTEFTLTFGQDKFVGSAGNDMFLARTINNGNTLQDGDQINGGAGNDTLVADLHALTDSDVLDSAITPVLTNVETVVIRAQSTPPGIGGNNLSTSGVFIDAQRSLAVDSLNTVTAATGVTRWESNNSRSDVIIEDVRIGNDQKTSDVTIAFVESDPGNVDFGVYFDQHSLRNTSSGTTGINILLMDAAAARVEATAATPLLNHNFNTYTFFVDNVKVILGGANTPAGKALDDATTYPALKAAFELALKTASVGGVTQDLSGVVAVTMSGMVNMTAEAKKAAESAVVAESFLNLSGQVITLTTAGSSVIASKSAAGEAGGWTAAGPAPSTGAIVQTFNTGTTSVTELVTSKIILDDVGRGSTGGDLVVGGMSVGTTSTSRGVERFEITVNDNSKLQTINSTNNALREVTIENGATSKTVTNAYTTTVKDEGDLTVNGTVGVGDTPLAGVEVYSRGTTLNGAVAQTHAGFGAAGFTDVRLIDASAFKGKLAFTAAITRDSIPKYVTAVDTAANPAADVATVGGNSNFNVRGANFLYTGGNDNDTMVVNIDSAAVSSRSSIVSGLSDMTFKMDGGAGDDAITVRVIDPTLAGGAQAWYNNQQLNANISIDGGDGNDVIRTPGAGDVVINAGAGNDVVYTDNTGALATPAANGAASAAATAYANAAAAELSAGLAAAVASNTTGFVRVSGTEAGGSAFVTTAAAANALNTLDLVTPEVYAAATAPTYAGLQAQIVAAVAAGGLNFEQANALASAYKTQTTAGVVTPAATLIDQAWTPGTANAAGVISAADFAAGNAVLATYVAAAKAAAASATAADTLVAPGAAYDRTGPDNLGNELLNRTQKAVVVATQAVNGVFDPIGVPSGINVAITGYTQGVTPVVATAETQIVTLVGNASGPVSFLGTAVAGSAAADTAAQTAAKIAAGSAAIIAAWNALPANATQQIAAIAHAAPADTFVTVTFTGPMGDVANLAASAGSAGIGFGAGIETAKGALGVVGATESFTATITGAAAVGEIITVDGAATPGFVGGETPAQIAAAINLAINLPAGSFVAVNVPGTNVLNVTAAVPLTAVPGTVAAADFVSNVSVPVLPGTQTTVNNLAALNSALVAGATDAAVVTALQTAIDNGAIQNGAGPLQANTIFGHVNGGSATMTGPEFAAIQLIMTQLQTNAANANAVAQRALTTALTADTNAVNTAALAAAASPVNGNDHPATPAAAAVDNIGSVEAALAATAAANAVTTYTTNTVNPLTAQATNLAALKAALAEGATDLQAWTATTNAVANGAITAGDKAAIDAAVGMVGSVPMAAGNINAGEKINIDQLISALQFTNGVQSAAANQHLANLSAIATATATASTIAAAARDSGGAGTAEFAVPQKAVFVFNTANQAGTYNVATMDERNLADLKSDTNNVNNFFNSTVKVSYKGIDASMVVPGSGFKTSDLEINQALKNLINNDAALKHLLLATDGPANTLVVTSLIDGAHTPANMSVSVTMPTAVSAADLAGAATAYGLPASTTAAALLTTLAASKTAFDAKGDYTTQLAESGARAGNVTLTGAASTSSSDNTITGAAGNDVIVLGTTVGTDAMTSSNEKVVFSGSFGNDTIVNFAASGLGVDTLDFSALNGRGNVALNSLTADKSIVIGTPTAAGATVLTAAQIAALFTDSATAISHVYVAVDATNIGSIWQVADAAGTAAGNVTATLVGSIDLADTAWSTLTAANFA